LRGRLAIIVISTVLLLGNSGFYTTPTFGGGTSFTFDGGPGGTGQDWNTAANWSPDGLPTAATDAIFIPPTFDVNINSPVVVQVGDPSQGATLTLVSGSTLTIIDGATLNHFAQSIGTIRVDPGSTLTVEGDLNNNFPAEIIVVGLLVVTSTGTLTTDGPISGSGDMEVCGTLNDSSGGLVTVNQVACSAGAPVGSLSIPLD